MTSAPDMMWPREGGVWEPSASLSSFPRVLGLEGGNVPLNLSSPEGHGPHRLPLWPLAL